VHLHDALGTRRKGRHRDERSQMGEEGAYGSDLVISVQQEGGGGQMPKSLGCTSW